ncbi:MAG: adenylyl-sulfate kinase [Bacteroidales bacterium]|nr:adenylyl-sulfate kinase [Bacteroidales bacterium]
MTSKPENIHPIFDRTLKRVDKQKMLNQNSVVIWLTGLSGSGKSTIAIELEKRLHERGVLTQLLDGDNVRAGINNNLGFKAEDRLENIRRIAEVSKLFVQCGVVTINSFVSPTNDVRELAKTIIGEKDYFEVYIKASVEACEKRDVKGLYAKARRGELPNFTGISAPFDVPLNPSCIIDTELSSIEVSVEHLLNKILPIIKEKNGKI